MPFDNLQKIAGSKLQKQKPRQLQQEQSIAAPKAPEPQSTTKPSPAGAGQVQLPQAKPRAAAPAIANNSLDPNHRGQAPSAGGVYGQQRVDTIANAPVSANFERGPAVGGTGFVNLGHLLSINRKSGEQNAKQLADKRAQAAAKAQSDLQKYQNQFENKVGAAEVFFDKSKADDPASKAVAPPDPVSSSPDVETGTTRQSMEGESTRPSDVPDDVAQYNDLSFLNSQANKAAQGYKGPSGLGDIEGYNDFEKGARNTADSVTNLGKGNEGIAAEIAKDTGLSGKQSSMSAFYSGADNEDLVGVSKKYGNLGKILDKAGTDSRERVQLAKDRTQAAKTMYDQTAADKQARDAASEQARRETLADIAYKQEITDRESGIQGGPEVMDQGSQSDNRNGQEDLNYVDNETWAAKHGNSYDVWVQLGRPMTKDEYDKALAEHPELVGK